MAEKPGVGATFLVMAFAAGVVAIGAAELDKRFGGKVGRESAKSRQLVEDLQGGDNTERASLSRAQRRSRAGSSIFTLPASNEDKLGSEDKEELDNLLNRVAP